MLKELVIENYALIDHLKINFEDGFSVITGETGSGKSIMLGALALILGERADSTHIRDANKKCIIEGTFDVSKTDLESLFELNDIDFESNTIIRREINSQGKSRAFVNDTPVSLILLKEIGAFLIDVHSQNTVTLLNSKSFIYDIIDNRIGDKNLMISYKEKYKQYSSLQKQLQEKIEIEKSSQNEKDFLTFLFDEFAQVDVQAAIDNEYEKEFNILSHAEEIKSLLNESINYLSDDANGVINNLKNIEQRLTKLSQIDSSYTEFSERLSATLIELKDMESDFSKKESNLDLDEKQLFFLESKLSELNRLQLKHNLASIEELLSKKNELASKIQEIGSISQEIEEIQKASKKIFDELSNLAIRISKERAAIIPKLEADAKTLLGKMSMKNAAIKFDLITTKNLSAYGFDDISLHAMTNLGGSFELLKKIASGGESSRIMLAIKSLQTEHKSLPTIIFDEIDTGVSGEVATNMGDIMSSLGNKMQVVSITHLAQIASKGKQHYKVFKEESNNKTHTRIIRLDDNGRVSEIAQMLSSRDITDAAISNAKELLNN